MHLATIGGPLRLLWNGNRFWKLAPADVSATGNLAVATGGFVRIPRPHIHNLDQVCEQPLFRTWSAMDTHGICHPYPIVCFPMPWRILASIVGE